MLGSIIIALVLREPWLAIDRELFTPRRLLRRVMWRAIAAVMILLAIGLATRGLNDIARQWLLTWCALQLAFTCLSRSMIVAYLHQLAMRGALREAVAVVGAPDVAGRLAARLGETAAVVKIVNHVGDAGFDTPLSDALCELLDLARAGAVDTVVVALNSVDFLEDKPILHHFRSLPVQVTICSNEDVPVMTRRKLRLLGSVPMSVVAERPLQRWDLLVKGAMDRIGALLLLIILMPVMMIAAFAVALESPGPIIFQQQRSGWAGQLFTMYKFRTMRHAPGVTPRVQTIRNDPRCTRVGALLRRASIDELPQLWNVLRGDMSLVGPRPHADVLHQTERAGCTVVAEYAHRHTVKPGLTGWAQIHGSRGSITSAEALRRRVTYDLYYIDNWSIWLDLSILARTPWALLLGENAF
jgi:putative colanic acid biosynthesis UDP-glucose lipid carrier transferase